MKTKKRRLIIMLFTAIVAICVLVFGLAFKKTVFINQNTNAGKLHSIVRQLPLGYSAADESIVETVLSSEFLNVFNKAIIDVSPNVYLGKILMDEYEEGKNQAKTNKEFIDTVLKRYYLNSDVSTIAMARHLQEPIRKTLPGFNEPVELNAESIPQEQFDKFFMSDICKNGEFSLDRYSEESLLNGHPLINSTKNSAWEEKANMLIVFPRNNCRLAKIYINNYFEPMGYYRLNNSALLSQAAVRENIENKTWQYYALYNVTKPNQEDGLPELKITKYFIDTLELAYYVVDGQYAIPYWRICGQAFVSHASSDSKYRFCAATHALDPNKIPKDAKLSVL